MKSRLIRKLSKMTCDKRELHRIVLKYKKRFAEACEVLDGKKKK